MIKGNGKILTVLLLALLLRFFYALNLPLNGDEVGVAALQATGQAVGFKERLPDTIVPRENLEEFIRYSRDFSEKDVLDSLTYAGMHPPLYYLLLHYVLKFFGNAALTLRIISIFASLLSIIYIYRLGKILFNEKVGLYSALILALSGYGIWMGTLVRPYSLVMLLSLISTYQAYRLNSDRSLNIGNKKLYLYALTVTLGLYTLYHFLFVFIFQVGFLLLSNFRNKRAIPALITVIALTFTCLLPWIPSLLDQMKVVTGGNYYFHQPVNMAHFIGDALSINFIRYFHISHFQIKVILALFFGLLSGSLIILGIYGLFRKPAGRIFIWALALYFLIYCFLETALGMSTFHDIKMLFFIFPVFVIFLAIGFSLLQQRFRLAFLALTLFCIVLSANSIAACCLKPRFGGPTRYLEILPAQINESLNPDQKGLLIINTNARRYLFPLVHAVTANVDFKILNPPDISAPIKPSSNLDQYDYIFLVNIQTGPTTPALSDEKVEFLGEFLRQHEFFLEEYIDSGYKPLLRSLYVFQRQRI